MSRNFLLPLTGCIGQPVAENPTQVMIEAAYASLDLDWRYVTMEVPPAGLRDAVAGFRATGFVGFNCTIPHKVAVIDHLDELGDSARLMQAVNCVVRRGDRLIGENTDGKGFVRALTRRRDPRGADVTILGAGGAARAIAVELGMAGAARIRVVNRGLSRLAGLETLLRDALPDATIETAELVDGYPIPSHTEVLVNATSVGLFPDVGARLPIDLSGLSADALVADVVFNPARTALLDDARSIGCAIVDGLEMLVGQGVIGVEYWTGRTPDEDAMTAALLSVL